MTDVYLVDGLRTAIGTFGGALAPLGCTELGRVLVSELLKRNKLKGADIDDLIFGSVLQAGQGQNIARQIGHLAGLPYQKPSLSINMVCGSGLRAVCLAAQSIRCQDASLVVAGGTESMSNAPYLINNARFGYRSGDGILTDSMLKDGLLDAFYGYHMGVTAENIAEKYGLSRQAQDEFACRSQEKTKKAMTEGKFADEIIPVSVPQRKGAPLIVQVDEHPRQDVTLEKLAKLKPAFKENGTVTAGNSSGINDGAAALLVAGSEALKKHRLTPMAKVAAYAYCGVDPAYMGLGPVEAVKGALRKADWKIGDLELIESNEAFAAQSLAVSRELSWDMEKVNVNGGAIALGHPIGASGARILVTALHEMKRRKAKKTLVTLCVGGGMGVAMCIEGV